MTAALRGKQLQTATEQADPDRRGGEENGIVSFFNDFAVAFDTLYDSRRGRVMRWLDRSLRSDMFVRFAWTFAAFGDLTHKTVLDIGCGSGPYVLEALRRGAARVTAVDPAPNMLGLVRKRLQDAGLTQRCSVVRGVFPGVALGRHDYAIVMGVMDYVRDPAAFLRALRPLVNDCLAVSFPSRHWWRTPLRQLRYRLRECPVFFFAEQEITELGQHAGFSRVDVTKIPGAGMDYHVVLRP